MEIIRTCTNYARKILSVCALVCACIGGIFPSIAFAQEESGVDNEYVLGKVTGIVEEGTESLAGFEDAYQLVLVEITSGENTGEVTTIDYRSSIVGFEQIRLNEGDMVVLVKTGGISGGEQYYILERFRLPVIVGLALLFGALAVILGRWKGAMSLVGLGVSLVVLTGFVVPRIMAGDSPILISAAGALIIATTSLFLAHGFTRRTLLAFSATIFVLTLAFGLAYVSVAWALLSGASTEEAVFLQAGFLQSLDLRGLLLGGLVIGALGVLDDVTTAQVAAVEEISRADRSLDAKELYHRGISIGREHIASLVNTLALAYVGASFPLFLLFSLPDNPPLWVLLNSETIAVEMLRALIGGSALMLAVPVSTALAAWACARGFVKVGERHHAGHGH